MKRSQKWFTGMLMAAAILSSSVFAPKANAYSLISLIGNGYVVSATGNSTSDTVLCIVLLPFCLLKDSTAPGKLTEKDLIDNGYSKSDVASIFKGQDAVLSYLTQSKSRISEKGALSSDQLAEKFAAIPGVTHEYVDFVRSN